MKKPAPLSPAGAEIVGALAGFLETIQADGDIAKRFTVRTVELNLEPRAYSAGDVRKVRDTLDLSQALFAQFLGVDVETVRAWEGGSDAPSPMASRFLDEIALAPEHWRGRVRDSIVAGGPDRPVKAS